MAKELVGEVSHYFGNMGVAALSLKGELKLGDKISIEHRDGSVVLEQKVDSMQIDMKPVPSAKAGEDVAIKVDGRVHRGNVVYKTE
ncbi:translation elongation factor-like protein [Candidatus Micrarchaeota archaeon]|nr:translation elongation factor-like protein [Candidatus Micrarchaeota archaeon]